MRRLLILVHRYLGIPLSVVFVIWFISGIVMMYTGGMPSIARDERLARLEPLAPASVQLSPAAALDAANIVASPVSIRLQTLLGRPAYRFGFGFGGEATVFADDGALLDEVSVAEAVGLAARYLEIPPDALDLQATHLSPDQWTLTLSQSLPLYEFSADDGKGTRIYVSAGTGDVVLETDRFSRLFAWIGVIPHWFYFTPLRLNQPVWYWTVVSLASLGCVLAALGLVLGVTQFRRSVPFDLARSIRYRGWMRWHYFSGVLFGVFALTWVFSGLMSMEPFGWTRLPGLEVPRSALTGQVQSTATFPALAAIGEVSVANALTAAAEVEFLNILGAPYLLVTPSVGRAKPDVEPQGLHFTERLHQPYPLTLERPAGRYLVSAETLEVRQEPFSTEALVAALEGAANGAHVVDAKQLDEYDAYYYSRNDEAPLPVLRLKFDDPLSTWYYVDPVEGRVVSRVHRYGRLERWLFSGLHSLDFAFWYTRRPLWDVGMIALSLGALLTSAIGLCLGWRRLFGSAKVMASQ